MLNGGLGYPMESKMLKLKPGSHRLEVLYGEVRLGKKSIHPKPGYIYTAVIGNSTKANDSLTVSLLENPSRTLLESR